jgi:hypothetical protein
VGYDTKYSLQVSQTSSPGFFITRLRSNNEEIAYALYTDGGLFNRCHWYDHEKDMKAFSEEHRGVLFTLHGEVESGEVWVKYFFNGKMQVEEQPKWVPPPFDKSKLL